MPHPVGPRVNKALLPPVDVRLASVDTDVKRGRRPEVEDTSYHRIEALRSARAGAAEQATSGSGRRRSRTGSTPPASGTSERRTR